MTLDQIVVELSKGNVTPERAAELEKELYRIETDGKIRAAEEWARSEMISREQLRSITMDLEIERSKLLSV